MSFHFNMDSTILRKFKVIRCPLDSQVLRPNAFNAHVKQNHKQASQQWTNKVKREASCLICTAPKYHIKSKLQLMAPTRRGNDDFIAKHGAHLPLKQKPLSEREKKEVRHMLHPVDLDASPTMLITPSPPPPPPPPINDDTIPSSNEAVGIIENWQNLLTTGDEPQDDTAAHNTSAQSTLLSLTRDISTMSHDEPSLAKTDVGNQKEQNDEYETQQSALSGLSSLLSHVGPVPDMPLDMIESSLYFDDDNPFLVEPNVANKLTSSYRDIFQAGLEYPHSETRNASTSMSESQHQQKSAVTDAETMTTNEDIPLLTQGVEHIREINTMKNTMLSQLLQDNIDLLERKLQSRKQALQAMENLFETHTRSNSPVHDDITLELSRIVHLKDKFMQQILRETAQLQPHVYKMMMTV